MVIIDRVFTNGSNELEVFKDEIEKIVESIPPDEKEEMKKIKKNFTWEIVPTWKEKKESLEMMSNPSQLYEDYKKLKVSNNNLKNEVNSLMEKLKKFEKGFKVGEVNE